MSTFIDRPIVPNRPLGSPFGVVFPDLPSVGDQSMAAWRAHNDLYATMIAPSGKKRLNGPSTSSSAVSRKNKLQRCGVCGGLGHKARTCELGALKEASQANDLASDSNDPIPSDPRKDPRTVLAAYGLLALNSHGQQLRPVGVQQCGIPLLVRTTTQYGEQLPKSALHQPPLPPPLNPLPAMLSGSTPPCSPNGRLGQPWREPLSPRWLAT